MEEQVGKNPVDSREEEAKSSVEREGADSELTGRARSLANLTGTGRKKGQPNKITKTIKEAVLEAVQPGACHPDGFAGWLIERSQGGIEDRKIFAGVVSRVIPVEVTGTDGGPIKIDLGWLGQRRIGYGDVIDVTPQTQEPQQIEQMPSESATYGGRAPDSISVDTEHKDGKA